MNNPAKCPTGMKRFMEFPAVLGVYLTFRQILQRFSMFKVHQVLVLSKICF